MGQIDHWNTQSTTDIGCSLVIIIIKFEVFCPYSSITLPIFLFCGTFHSSIASNPSLLPSHFFYLIIILAYCLLMQQCLDMNPGAHDQSPINGLLRRVLCSVKYYNGPVTSKNRLCLTTGSSVLVMAMSVEATHSIQHAPNSTPLPQHLKTLTVVKFSCHALPKSHSLKLVIGIFLFNVMQDLEVFSYCEGSPARHNTKQLHHI